MTGDRRDEASPAGLAPAADEARKAAIEKAAAVIQCRTSWPQADALATDLANAGLLAVGPPVPSVPSDTQRQEHAEDEAAHPPSECTSCAAIVAAEDANLAARVLAFLDRTTNAELAHVSVAALDAAIHGDDGWQQAPLVRREPSDTRERVARVLDEHTFVIGGGKNDSADRCYGCDWESPTVDPVASLRAHHRHLADLLAVLPSPGPRDDRLREALRALMESRTEYGPRGIKVAETAIWPRELRALLGDVDTQPEGVRQ